MLQMYRHRHRAIAFDPGQEAAFTRNGNGGCAVVEAGQLSCERIAFARLERQRALAHRGQHAVLGDALGDHVLQSQALEPRACQDHRVEILALELGDACRHVAAQGHDFEIRPCGQQQRAPSRASRTDPRALAQAIDPKFRVA
jgi:hypothetical protein